MSRSKRNAAAEDYFRRAPNYSAEAIRDLLAAAEELAAGGCAELAEAHLSVVSVISAAHKFLLPDGGLLFEKTSPWMREQWRLPFQSCVFEFAGLGDVTPSAESESDPGWVRGQPTAWCVFAVEGREDTKVSSVYTMDVKGQRRWTLAPGYLSFPHTHRVGRGVFDGEAIPLPRGEELPLDDSTGFFVSSGFFCSEKELRIAEPAVWHHLESIRDGRPLHSALIRLLRQEGHVAAQACAALSCTNVTTEIIRPNREAHAIRPASTLFDYHVLMIDPGKVREPGEVLGGSHASPRTHLRRGHIRRHPTAGRIWVNSCVVAPTSIGTVNKDYRVGR